ncbi:hypothetical protein C5S31_03060 [ANME-1 cluster archaeon GoMg2]|nr:hypothetical protein [ANME-1 cluster archaeon GoMg2]
MLVPKAVFTELGVKKDTVYHDVETLIGKSFIEIEEVKVVLIATLTHTGEAEAITLAKKLNCWIALGDSKVRGIAMREGL